MVYHIGMIEICRGLTLPFFPMRPALGRTLRTPKLVEDFLSQLDVDYWLMQPKLNGDRGCLATVRDQTYVQNRHGGWYSYPVKNAAVFLRLGNGCCWDGEIYEGNFHPFEALAVRGKLCFEWPVGERVDQAKSQVESIGQPWLFDAPSAAWLLARQANAPKWEGVVLKRRQSLYLRQGSPDMAALTWIKRRWDNRKLV